MACNPNKIVAALYEQAEEVNKVVYERQAEEPRYGLRMIADGGTVRRHSNQDTVIYGEAKQAPVGYRSLDHSPRNLVAGGEFPARTLQGAQGIFENDTNEIDDNACHGQVTIDFSQGYRIRRTSDYGLDLDTPVKCARELDRLGEAHIRGYFEGFKNQFTTFGTENFSENLLNLAIQFSEANAAVLGPNEFNVSTSGWQAPPLYRISIHFLQDYRDHIMAEMKGRGLSVSEDWKLEVEMPRNDWFDAVFADQVHRGSPGSTAVTNGVGTRINTELLKDEEGALRGRQFHEYGGIKCYFNETPIRGFLLPTSLTTHRFVRVYDWINAVDEEGGVSRRPNHQYREDTIEVNGQRYPMITLIPHIDPRSFKRYGLIKPLKPYGNSNAGVNFELRVIDGARLGGNDYDDKFKFAYRHEFRFQAIYPELSGFIAYRSSRRTGYVLEVNSRTNGAGTQEPVSPQSFRTPGNDDWTVAECAQCDKVPDADKQCVTADSEAIVLRLVPSDNALEVLATGAAYDLEFTVERTGGTAACSVAYATADVSGSGDAITSTSGTLEWEDGDTAPKTITVPVLAGADDNDSFTLTISGATSTASISIASGANVATVTFTA